MAKFSVNHIEPGATITASDLNSAFAGLEDNSDGTAGRIDTVNVRSAAITRQHLAVSAVHQNFTTALAAGIVVHTSGVSSAPTSWANIVEITLAANPVLASGDVLRWHFSTLIRDVVSSGPALPANKAQQLYYLRVQATVNDGGGDLTVEITPPYGYGLCERSSNEAASGGSKGGDNASWTRNPLTGIWVNRSAGRIFRVVRLQLLMQVNDDAQANTVATGQTNGFAVVERL